jgi:orotidine-5'-phosphate decarboxylase
MTLSATRRLIVALDVPEPAAARALVTELGDTVECYKIGLELVLAGGLNLVRALKAEGKFVFLDMKLLDIGHTVEKAVAQAARLGADLLTVHGLDRKTLRAAVAGRDGAPLKLLSVTVMTHLDAADLAEQGIASDVGPHVLRRAGLAAECGFDGVIASPWEAADLRRAHAAPFLIVTPGGAAAGDQTRVATPTFALAQGADQVVVGRPITAAADPRGAAQAILAELSRN